MAELKDRGAVQFAIPDSVIRLEKLIYGILDSNNISDEIVQDFNKYDPSQISDYAELIQSYQEAKVRIIESKPRVYIRSKLKSGIPEVKFLSDYLKIYGKKNPDSLLQIIRNEIKRIDQNRRTPVLHSQSIKSDSINWSKYYEFKR